MVTGNYVPGKNGGIENYTHLLAKLLLERQYEVEVAALDVNEKADYFYEGVKVNFIRESIYCFEELIKDQSFDICHFQEYAEFGGIEIPWFQLAKQYCQRVFFTFHLPYLTCYKNDFRYNGVEDCTIFIDSERCVKCVIADRAAYRKMGNSDWYLSAVMAVMALSGRKDKLEKSIRLKYQKLNELIANCDKVFIYAGWFKHLLEVNGYDFPNIKKIPYTNKRSAVDSGNNSIELPETKEGILEGIQSIKYRLIFVGRIQHQKGLHLLCQAMNNIRNKNISLDVYGNIVDKKYFDDCVKKYSFSFRGTTNYSQLLDNLKDYDFLVLPSVFTEMSSLIVKDAFYERLPVIGSAAKGNRDVINDEVNGFLFKYDDANDLSKVINKAYNLKESGWFPKFDLKETDEMDLDEILSYYK